MRDPSIHIRLSQMIEILEEIHSNNEDSPVNYDWAKFCDELFKRAKNINCSNRGIHITNDKSQRNAEKILVNDSQTTLMFQSAFIKVRRSLKHVGVRAVKPGEKDWGLMKTIASNALVFASDFQLKPEEAYIIYSKIALNRLKKFNISHIPNLHSNICDHYLAELELMKDPYEALSYKAYQEYRKLIIEKVGLSTDYFEDPTTYREFTKVPPIVKRLGGKIQDYILSQFDGLAWTGSYPEPSQLSGPKAEQRYLKYCYKNNIRLK